MKERDKNPQDQKMKRKKATWKRIQSDDSKDDPKSYKQNGGTDK